MSRNSNILRTLLIVFLCFFCYNAIVANNNIEELKKNLPKMLGASNAGTEFYLTFHPCIEQHLDDIDKIKVYVSSEFQTNVTLEIEGKKGFIQTKKTIPNDVIEFVLDPSIGQCYELLYTTYQLEEQVFRGCAIHIYSDDPIICYGFTSTEITIGGFLALPVHTLGKEYIVASYLSPFGHDGIWGPCYTSVVAAYNNTKVRFILGGTESTVTKGGMKPEEYKDYSLNKGDVLLVASGSPFSDLTGSRVIASKPVGLISGNYCTTIPVWQTTCGYTIEMELPTNTWGKNYFVTRIKDRIYNSIIKIFAKEPNTKIYRDGKQIGIIPNVGGVYGVGYLEMRVSEGFARCAVISGDKPISVTQYNPNREDDGVNLISPFQMVLTPLEQFQNELLFNAPWVQDGKTYSNNYINLVYEANENGGMPDDLEFVTSRGTNKLSVIDPVLGDPFAYQVNGKNYNAKIMNLTDIGLCRLRANKPIAAYIYGYKELYDAYGYPACMALKDLTKPDSVCPNPTWTINCTGIINDGLVTDLPNDYKVRSNLSVIYFNKEQSYNFNFSYDKFFPGEDFKTKWKANVKDPSKDARAVITFSDRCGNDTTIVIEFFAPKFTIRPDFADYGLLEFGDVVDKTFWAIN